jgi:hypothetical protein
MLVKKPLMLSVRKLSDRSQELKESGLVNFGRFSLSLQKIVNNSIMLQNENIRLQHGQ